MVVILTVILGSECESVRTVDPGEFVQELHGVVVDCKRTIVGVADSGEAATVKSYVRNSPRDWIARLLVRDADVGNDVQSAGAQSPKRVEETCIAKTGFVHDCGAEGARVGYSPLFVVR